MADSNYPSWVRSQTANFGLWFSCVLGECFLSAEPDAWSSQFLIVVEKLTGQPLEGRVEKPKLKVQKLANCQLALRRLKECGVKVVGVGPEDLCWDLRWALSLGLMWTVILHWEVYQFCSQPLNKSAKLQLLLGVRDVLGGYEVKNFSSDWESGGVLQRVMQKTLFRDCATLQSVPGFAESFPAWLEIASHLQSRFPIPREIWHIVYSLALIPQQRFDFWISAACAQFGIPPFVFDVRNVDELSLIAYVAMVLRTHKCGNNKSA